VEIIFETQSGVLYFYQCSEQIITCRSLKRKEIYERNDCLIFMKRMTNKIKYPSRFLIKLVHLRIYCETVKY